MRVFEKPNVPQREYKGTVYYFCNPGCAVKFDAEPERFIKTPGSEPMHALAPPPVAAGSWYTCPMDPEVRQKGPGACPKCGMALEPAQPLPASRTEWVCPMHPEIVRGEPGSCPVCGMALEPRTVAVEEQRNPELVDM